MAPISALIVAAATVATLNTTFPLSATTSSSIVAVAAPSNLTIPPFKNLNTVDCIPSAVAVGASFVGCGSFPGPGEANGAPQAFWPPQVQPRPGRACIGYPNWYMMECCNGARDYICGWEACIGTMSDNAIESCFRRLAIRDGRRSVGDDDDDDQGFLPGEFVNLTRRRRKYSFNCASAGARSAAPSSSGKLVARVTVLAVTVAFATSVLAAL
ncbi:hypothetical protein CcaverHIS631_0108840 [Cutaneotrichosporon cavernicola]|nr:hypothetical protein CcaverHIS631_0108840 [Cutaneotrichosporon cavernicola]